MWSTFCRCTWMAGVSHCKQEHFLPDHTTSPILTLHFGQSSRCSFSPVYGSHRGTGMK